jgi:hypothetical protein
VNVGWSEVGGAVLVFFCVSTVCLFFPPTKFLLIVNLMVP